jgi:hypothetical protein
MEGRIQNVHGAVWPQLKDLYTGEETMNFVAGKFRVGEEYHVGDINSHTNLSS